jgi:hypothetical protein
MTYFEIEHPPHNAGEYVKVPPSDVKDEFISSLVNLFAKKTELICTDAVPMDWITSAFYSAHFDGHNPYKVYVVRAAVNYGEKGSAFGYFFLERQKPKSN